MNINRFCIFLLLTTLICIIAGMFLVFTSLHYDEKPEQELRTEVRREAGEMKPDSKNDEPYPVFPDDYHASGLLILPHSSIAEPFEIWYSTTLGASRIDYYYGTDQTYQRGDEGDNGMYYKVVPMYNDKRGNFEGCWTLKGTKYRPIFAQTVVPNITWFKYVQTEVYTGTLATKWHYEYWAYGMLNSQYVWVTKSKPHRPIRYEMKGYDAMLGSYYDHYVLEYISFEKWKPQMKRLEMRQDVQCFNWSLTLESSLIANPMQEFTPFSAERLVDVNEMYTGYKNNHGKVYEDKKEHIERKHIYKHNMRYIRSINRKKNHFKLASNHFTDLSDDEFEAQLGSITKADPRNHTGLKKLHKHKPTYVGQAPSAIDVPEQLDWRDYGAVSTVKGQGICGSCYTFSAAGAAEGAHFLKTGNLVELSSQQILDCSWGSGNHGCKGGHYAAALSFLYLHGAATLDSYGKYLAQEGVCHFNDTILGAKPDAFAYVPGYNNTALKRAIAKFGPAAISINVSPMSFKFYSSGIYHDPDCWSNRTRHSALVIGYGSENGKEYWIVKNSWSDTWGEKGYMRVAMDGNTCGITEAPVVALVNHVTFQFPVKEKITSIDNSADPLSMGRKVKAMKKKKKSLSKAKKAPKKSSRKRGNRVMVEHVENPDKKSLQHAESQGDVATSDEPHQQYKEMHNENFMAGQKAKVAVAQNLDQQFQQKVSQFSNMDDKETPKVEPHNEKHDIGALGDVVATSESVGAVSDDVSVVNQKEARDKTKADDFKLPVLPMSVDQSKLPNVFSENMKSQTNPHSSTESNPVASIEPEGINDVSNLSVKVFDGRAHVSVNANNDMDDVGVTIAAKNSRGSNDAKKTKRVHKNTLNSKRTKHSKKDWLKNIETVEKRSFINGIANILPRSRVDRMQSVLTNTMTDLYSKIDEAIISAKKG